MSDREPLYRAILANPADDTARLVYADWLQENDRGEEAEFIRVQCRLASVAPDHPEYPDLLGREEELRLWLAAHAPARELRLSAGLSVEGGRRWWAWTRRGFPRFLEFEGTDHPGVKSIRALAAAVEKAFARLPTRWLVVRFLTVEQLAELVKQPVLAGLDRIIVQLREDVDAAAAAGLIARCAHLRNLRGASLAFPVDESAAADLARSQYLGQMEWLSVDVGSLTGAAIRTLSTALWFCNLHSLVLDSGLPTDAFEELCRGRLFPSLHSLDLSENAFPASAWDVFARSKAFPRLTQLDLRDTDMSDGRMASLTAAGHRLAVLDLTRSSIGRDGAEAFADSPHLASLRCLRLGYNRLGSRGVAAVGGGSALTELRHLDLSYNGIGTGGLRALTRNPALRGLTSLQLADVPVLQRTPDHMREFLERLNTPGLRHLDLSGLPLGPKVARLLAGAKFGSLTRLNLSRCRLTDAATAALIAAPALQGLIELNLEQNVLKTVAAALTVPGVLPRLSACPLFSHRIDATHARQLARRGGVQISQEELEEA